MGTTKIGRPQEEIKPLPVFDSMEQCFAVLGIPLKVQRAAKKAGCVAFKSNRVYPKPLIEWIFANEDSDSVTDWNQALAQEKTFRERIKRQKDEEAIADRPTVQRRAGKIMAMIFDTLERSFCYELPGSVVGKNEPAIAAEAKAVINGLRKRLVGEIEALGKTDEAAV